jgi:hypothetical protein
MLMQDKHWLCAALPFADNVAIAIGGRYRWTGLT